MPEQRVRDYGMQSITNLIVRQKFGTGTGPTIALNAHGDVVPPGEGWSFDPYGGEVRDGRMYARGVAVSKSDIAGFTFALDALKAAERAGAKLNGNVELHLTYDEEFGGLLGPGYLLEQKGDETGHVIGASSVTPSSPRTTVACNSKSPCTARRRTARCPKPATTPCRQRTRS